MLEFRYRQLQGGEFNHTSVLILLDGQGRMLARTEQLGAKPDPEFLAAIRGALRESKNGGFVKRSLAWVVLLGMTTASYAAEPDLPAALLGGSAWRQNEQTFDALTFRTRRLPRTLLSYSYLDNLNRVFEPDAGNPPPDLHLQLRG